MTFLPKGYKSESGKTSYFKIKQGENKLRILSSATIGLEIWTHDNKPERFKLDSEFALGGGYPVEKYKAPPKEFWAFLVWNYDEKKIQLASITQISIKGQLQALAEDKDFGDPKDYDIKIKRSGEGMETKYIINALPPKELDAEQVEALLVCEIDIDQLFEGNDPTTKKKPVPATVDDFSDLIG